MTMHRKLPPVAAQFADHGPLTIIAMGVVVLFTIVVILSLIVVAHHLITERRRRGNRLRFEGVSIALAPHIVANQPGLRDAVAKAQEEYGDRAVALVLRRIRYDLRGPVVDRVSGFLTTMGEVKDLLAKDSSRMARPQRSARPSIRFFLICRGGLGGGAPSFRVWLLWARTL